MNAVFRISAIALPLAGLAFGPASTAEAAHFKFNKSVTMKVGQRVVLKGVRNRRCGGRTPRWSTTVTRLPATRLGTYYNAGAGTAYSERCGATVPARGIGFTATRAGETTVKIFGDEIKIKVMPK